MHALRLCQAVARHEAQRQRAAAALPLLHANLHGAGVKHPVAGGAVAASHRLREELAQQRRIVRRDDRRA